MIPVELQAVEKSFGSHQVLKGLSLQVQKAEAVALLGPNGAGKSTTLDVLLGLQAFDQGSVKVFGHSPCQKDLKKIISCIPQELSYPSHLKVGEIIHWISTLHGVAVDEMLLTRFQVDTFIHQLAGGLSGGQKRRLALALAFMMSPQLVVLDEPTTGLDVDGKILMWKFLQDYKQQGGSLLVTSHDLYEVTQLVDRIVLIDQGRVVSEGKTHEVLARCKYNKVIFKYQDNLPEAAHGHCSKVERNGEHYICWSQQSDLLVRSLVDANVDFENLRVEASDLTDIFKIMREGSH